MLTRVHVMRVSPAHAGIICMQSVIGDDFYLASQRALTSSVPSTVSDP